MSDDLENVDRMLDSIAGEHGDLYAFSDQLLLVDEFSVLLVGGIQLGKPGVQPMISLTLSGKFNRRDERATFQVALEPRFMADLVRSIAETYGPGGGQRDAFGRPQ